LNDPAARAAVARKIARDSQPGPTVDRHGVLSQWDRETFFAFDSVQLRIPLRDPTMVRVHLRLMEEAVHALRFRLDQSKEGDRSDLLLVQGVMKGLNQKLNAYRSRKRHT
jgi:hypothetical protein